MTPPDLNAESPSAPNPSALSRPPNPYVGPGPFSRGDESRFFGRKGEIADLQSLVAAHRTVLLYSQSGAGKSSLLNAGLIPRLEAKGFDVLVGGRLSQSPPTGSDRAAIANIYSFNAMSTLLVDVPAKGDPAIATIAETLTSRPRRLIEKRGGPPRVLSRVLVLDQFEELLRSHPDRWSERRSFFEQLADAMETEPTLRVLFAMREDFVAALDHYDDILPEGFRTRYRLEMLRPEAALLGITEPLVGTGIIFSKGVAEQLVTDLRTNPVAKVEQISAEQGTVGIVEEFIEPVQLQVVCFSLFRKLNPGATAITDEDRMAFGNVDLALSEFYESALRETSERTGISTDELRGWFEAELVTEDETRGLVRQGKETTAGLRNEAILLMDEFHIIRPVDRSGGRWYEISHDRFIQPILRANDTWRAEVEAKKDQLQTKERIRLAEEVTHSKMLVRKFKSVTVVALIALALAAVMTGVAIKMASAARRETTMTAIALSQQFAMDSEDQFWQDPKAAIRSALKAFDTYQTDAAKKVVQEALEQSNLKAVLQAGAPLTAVGFSRNGDYIIGSTNTGRILVWDAANPGHPRTFASSRLFRASKDSISKDGRYLLSGVFDKIPGPREEYESRLVVYDLSNGSRLACVKANDIGGDVTSAVFSPGGDYIATGSEDFTVAIWDAKKLVGQHSPSTGCNGAGRVQVKVKNLSLDIVNSVRFSDDSSRLAISTQGGPGVLWDWMGNRRILLRRYSTASLSAEFNPENVGHVLVSGQDGFVTLWNVEFPRSAQGVWSKHLDDLPIWQASFDPAGKLIVTPSPGNTASVWDVRDAQFKYHLVGHHKPITGVAFSSDGTLIVTASLDGTARIWEAAPTPAIEELQGKTDYLRCVLSGASTCSTKQVRVNASEGAR